MTNESWTVVASIAAAASALAAWGSALSSLRSAKISLQVTQVLQPIEQQHENLVPTQGRGGAKWRARLLSRLRWLRWPRLRRQLPPLRFAGLFEELRSWYDDGPGRADPRRVEAGEFRHYMPGVVVRLVNVIREPALDVRVWVSSDAETLSEAALDRFEGSEPDDAKLSTWEGAWFALPLGEDGSAENAEEVAAFLAGCKLHVSYTATGLSWLMMVDLDAEPTKQRGTTVRLKGRKAS